MKNDVILYLCFLSAFLFACENTEPNFEWKDIAIFLPEFEIKTHMRLPTYTPCPDGWDITELDVGKGHIIEYCEPQMPPDSNHDPELNALSPLTPAPPNFLPCPQGWTEWMDEREVVVNRNGRDETVTRTTVTCNPYPEDEARDCGSIDQMHFIGEPGCSQIGTECPEGDELWATNIVDSREIVYVEAGAPAGGQGTKESPYGTINEAIAEKERYVVIALSKGVFDENVVLNEGITLWGACVAETILLGSQESTTEGVVMTTAPATGVRNLQITGNRLGVVAMGGSAYLQLEDVVLSGVYHNAINLSDHAYLTARNVVVRDMLQRSSDPDNEYALILTTGADLEMTRSVVQNTAGGITAGTNYHLNKSTTLKLYDVVVRDTFAQEGLSAFWGPQVEIKRSLFQRNTIQMIVRIKTIMISVT